MLIVNETELNAIAGTAITPESGLADIYAAVSALGRAASTTVVTLGARGAVARIGDRRLELAGREVEVVDTTGAGDCFVGALAARLAAGAEIDDGTGVRQRRGIDLRRASRGRLGDADRGRGA